jgi:hypothetical protein
MKDQKTVFLRPAERSFAVSGVSYKAIAPGTINATIVFNYRVETANSTFTTEDNTTRTHTFNIHKTVSTRAPTSNSATHYHQRCTLVVHLV